MRVNDCLTISKHRPPKIRMADTITPADWTEKYASSYKFGAHWTNNPSKLIGLGLNLSRVAPLEEKGVFDLRISRQEPWSDDTLPGNKYSPNIGRDQTKLPTEEVSLGLSVLYWSSLLNLLYLPIDSAERLYIKEDFNESFQDFFKCISVFVFCFFTIDPDATSGPTFEENKESAVLALK